jgi:hypothetical protein
MSPRLLRPILSGDPDALRYIAAVQQADQQSLEPAVRKAITDFVVGCKADGIWDALKASCILAGARTLSGALVPLKGPAPTNNNFVSGDYNRKTGLVGNGSTKFLDSNRAENTDGLNNNHYSSFVSTVGTQGIIGAVVSGVANTTMSPAATRNRNSSPDIYTLSAGFVGIARSSSSEYIRRNSGANSTLATGSVGQDGNNVGIFATSVSSGALFAGSHRLAFYSIGESLDLALLDTRVTALYNAIGAAI